MPGVLKDWVGTGLGGFDNPLGYAGYHLSASFMVDIWEVRVQGFVEYVEAEMQDIVDPVGYRIDHCHKPCDKVRAVPCACIEVAYTSFIRTAICVCCMHDVRVVSHLNATHVFYGQQRL